MKMASGPMEWVGFNFTGPQRPWNKSPKRLVPESIPRPDYAVTGIPVGEQQARSDQTRVLSPEEIEKMRVACRLGREVIDAAAAVVKVGVTTDEIDRVVHDASVARNCYPSPLNYREFPKSCCTSVNEVICHGIPDGYPLKDGDIVNVDVTVYHNGYHADLNETFYVGEVDADTKRLVKCAYECLDLAIKACKVRALPCATRARTHHKRLRPRTSNSALGLRGGGRGRWGIFIYMCVYACHNGSQGSFCYVHM